MRRCGAVRTRSFFIGDGANSRGAPLGGESEQTFFAFFPLVSRKHTKERGSKTLTLIPLDLDGYLFGGE